MVFGYRTYPSYKRLTPLVPCKTSYTPHGSGISRSDIDYYWWTNYGSYYHRNSCSRKERRKWLQNRRRTNYQEIKPPWSYLSTSGSTLVLCGSNWERNYRKMSPLQGNSEENQSVNSIFLTSWLYQKKRKN